MIRRPRPVSRRDAVRILTRLGIGAGGLAMFGCDTGKPREGGLGNMERWNEGVEKFLLTDHEVSVPNPTPEMAFPTYHIAPSVPVAPPGWKLKIGGMVDRPIELSLDELMAMSRSDLRIEHHCVEGWSAIADWHGVRLADLAARAGARSGDYVEFKSFDTPANGRAYWSSWDRASALHPQTLIAYGMNGKPLSPAHGAPARLYSSVKLGYKQVKYLSEINFLDGQTGGYWEDSGYEWFGGT